MSLADAMDRPAKIDLPPVRDEALAILRRLGVDLEAAAG